MVRHLRQVDPLQITAWIILGEGKGNGYLRLLRFLFWNDKVQATSLLGMEIQANEYGRQGLGITSVCEAHCLL